MVCQCFKCTCVYISVLYESEQYLFSKCMHAIRKQKHADMN